MRVVHDDGPIGLAVRKCVAIGCLHADARLPEGVNRGTGVVKKQSLNEEIKGEYRKVQVWMCESGGSISKWLVSSSSPRGCLVPSPEIG